MPLLGKSVAAASRAAAPRKRPTAASPVSNLKPKAAAEDEAAVQPLKDETARPPSAVGAPAVADAKPQDAAMAVAVAPAEPSLGIVGGTLATPSRGLALWQPQHAQMLESMDRKARELCDDTRRQYELLLQRQETQHERQLQALQHKLREVVGSSVALGDHRQALSELARVHERELRSLVKAHDDEAAALRLRCKQVANEQTLRRSRAFQDEKDFLLDKLAQLERDRGDALRQWREEELAALSARQELSDALQESAQTQTKLLEACQHIVALKAQLPKIDRLAKKVKDERAAHAAALAQWQQRASDAAEAKSALATRVGVLETEVRHLRDAGKTQQDELAAAKLALAARDAQAVDLQRALAEASAKEALLREFRDGERAAHEQQRSAWHAAEARLRGHEADARRDAAVLQQEMRSLETQRQTAAADAAREAESERRLLGALRTLQTKCARATQRVQQLEAALAERHEEARVDQLLFPSSR